MDGLVYYFSTKFYDPTLSINHQLLSILQNCQRKKGVKIFIRKSTKNIFGDGRFQISV